MNKYDGNTVETEEKGTKASKEAREKILRDRNTGQNNFKIISRHYYDTERTFLGRFRFSILHGMELLYAHYWGAYGIPIYIVYNNNVYYVTNNLSIRFQIRLESDLDERPLQNVYDIPQEVLYKNYKIRKNAAMLNEDKYEGIPTFSGVEELADTAPFLTIDKTRGEHYRHFLKKTDAAEICRFEDYFAHNRYTQMAVLNYPFKFLPFLHVDPRRIWGELDTDKHDFYCETGSNNELEQLNKETIKQNIDNT